MSESRDPRKDPQPGDVLRKVNVERRVLTREGGNITYESGKVGRPKSAQRDCWISTWQGWARGTEVIDVDVADKEARKAFDASKALRDGYVCLTGPKDQVMDVIWAGLEERIQERAAEAGFVIAFAIITQFLDKVLERLDPEKRKELLLKHVEEVLQNVRDEGVVVNPTKVNGLLRMFRAAAKGASNKDLEGIMDLVEKGAS